MHHFRDTMESRMALHVLQRKTRSGFMLLELLLGIAIFSIFLSGIMLTLIYGQENTVNGGDRLRGAYLAERTMEGLRAIRDGSFASVTTGTHGIAVNPATGMWAYSGTQSLLTGSYISSMVVASKGTGWVSFTGSTTWKHGYNRAGKVLLTGEMTDWKSTTSVGNWASPSLEGSYVDGGTPIFHHIAVSGNTAYVTNDAVGLYIFDISNTASPTRVNAGFNVGFTASGITIRGKRLYLITSDPSAELKVYSITSPTTPVLITSYNLPGSSLGKSLALGYNLLFVTANYTGVAGQHQLYSFDVSNSGSVILKGTLDDSDTMDAVALSGTSAYIGSSVDTAELRVVNAVASGSITLAGGFNLTDRILDGTAIAVSGTSALLGTQAGAIREVVVFDIGNGGVPSGVSGPWYHEGSGSIADIAMDPYRCFGFIAANTGHKAFQVMDLKNKSTLSELWTYVSPTGIGRGLAYDLVRDRMYGLTDSALYIFKPGVSIGTCP